MTLLDLFFSVIHTFAPKHNSSSYTQLSYLHGHFVVSALQEGGQVSQSTVLVQQIVVHMDYFSLAIVLVGCQYKLSLSN